jgi:hypothetical protein
MRKTYVTPTAILSGSVVADTKSVSSGIGEPANKKLQAGSVGFNL